SGMLASSAAAATNKMISLAFMFPPEENIWNQKFHFFAGFGIVANFDRYSGYIVAAPPRAASSGIWWAAGKSLSAGFVPGRKWGTTFLLRSTSSTVSQGYGATS